MTKTKRDMEERKQEAIKLLKEGINDGRYAQIVEDWATSCLDYLYEGIVKFAEDYANLRITEALNDLDEEENYEVPEDVIPRDEIEKITSIRRELSRKTGIPETDLIIKCKCSEAAEKS